MIADLNAKPHDGHHITRHTRDKDTSLRRWDLQTSVMRPT